MWTMFIIACLVCVLDKTGYLLTDKLEKLLYVEDGNNSDKNATTSTQKEKHNEKEKPSQNNSEQMEQDTDLKIKQDSNSKKKEKTKTPNGNPIKAEDALYEIKKAGKQ